MVDAKDLLFLQHAPQRVVDGLIRFEVVAQRLFEHHAGGGAVQAHGGDLFAHIGEQAGRGGHIHHHRFGIALAQHGGQAGVVLGFGQVHAQVVQQRAKALELVRGGALGQFHAVKTRLDQAAVLFVAQLVARHGNDAAPFGQRTVPERLKQCGHELAPGQITCSTKQDKVKTHGVSVSGCCGRVCAGNCNLVT
ncbi:hypothetical protein D3C72_1690880 [compost metagenome]